MLSWKDYGKVPEEAVDLCGWAGWDLWRLGEGTPEKGSSLDRGVERRLIITTRLGKGRTVSWWSPGAGLEPDTEHHEQLLRWNLGSAQPTMESSQESVNKK